MNHPKYKAGLRVKYYNESEEETYYGTIVKNYKLPGDICIKWDTYMESSYDVSWLEENNVEVVL